MFPLHNNILGEASWTNCVIRIYESRIKEIYPCQDSFRRRLVLLHEFYHYFQFVSTLDGISWFIQGLLWSDKLRNCLPRVNGPIPIPLLKSNVNELQEAISNWHTFNRTANLYINGIPNSATNSIPPALKLQNGNTILLPTDICMKDLQD